MDAAREYSTADPALERHGSSSLGFIQDTAHLGGSGLVHHQPPPAAMSQPPTQHIAHEGQGVTAASPAPQSCRSITLHPPRQMAQAQSAPSVILPTVMEDDTIASQRS